MINAFKKKRKISAFGIMSNTNTNGLDWDDRIKYGVNGNSVSYDEDNGGIMGQGGDDIGFDGIWKSTMGCILITTMPITVLMIENPAR